MTWVAPVQSEGHRVSRTGRAGAKSLALTLVSGAEVSERRQIERAPKLRNLHNPLSNPLLAAVRLRRLPQQPQLTPSLAVGKPVSALGTLRMSPDLGGPSLAPWCAALCTG